MINKIYSLDFSNKMSAKAVKQSSMERELNKFLTQDQVERVLELINTQSKKRTKTTKDPNAPKRWKSSYILFCGDRRAQLVSENPTLKATEITARLGKLWTALPDTEKDRYSQLSAQDKERFTRELAAYTGESKVSAASVANAAASSSRKKPSVASKVEVLPTPVVEKKSAATKASKATASSKVEKKPKATQQSAGFVNYSQETREEVESEHPEFNQKKVNDEILKRWNKLSQDQRETYELTAEDEIDLE